MPQVLIALGSNTQQCAHMQWATQRLAGILTDMRLSRKLWTADIHGTGILYMNQLAAGHTDLEPSELENTLKAIEAEAGRSKQRVTIDLDLMQYALQRYHLKDWPRPYIQQLIPDLL